MLSAPLLIDGRWVDGGSTAPVVDKFRGLVVAEAAQASPAQVDEAVAAARAAAASGPLHPHARHEVLIGAARMLEQRRPELIAGMVAEAGFTTADASVEVDRAVQTLTLSGEEATRIHGEVVPISSAPGVTGRLAFTLRRPVGVVVAITPFNSPLNTVAHKVGPALAAGNAVVLKPAELTPLTAGSLAGALVEAGLPHGWLNVVHGAGETVGQQLLEHPDPDFYTFTGSTAVGRAIQRTVGLRRTQLELGSLSCTIVCQDADPGQVAARAVPASFRKAGQVCTSVQRLYVHRDLLDACLEAMVEEVRSWPAGDPADERIRVGPLITEAEAVRVESWVDAAVDGGARVLHGGGRAGPVVGPTVVTDVPAASDLWCRELFGPVVSVVPYDDLSATLAEIDSLPYGLAAGVFTNDINRALRVATALRVGSVHVNDTSSSRVDHMPYGGLKASGFGKEGPKYASAEMTEETLVTITTPAGAPPVLPPAARPAP